jgi:PKD repeat protein
VPVLLACLVGMLLLVAPPAQAAVIDNDPFANAGIAAAAAAVPDEFIEETAFDDLVAPASVSFSPDGRVFVAQLDGVIKVFSGLDDTTPSVYADLSRNVAWHDDRGLLGMTLDPQFTTGRPYIYVVYTYDAAIGATAPRWNDSCPDPPGAERDGCVVSGRLSKILPDGSEQPLITNEWCQQYASHSLGDIKFGPDGALYATAGDGASYTFADYGQDGAPVNPCGDPPGAAGATLTPPTAEGGALRSQDVRTSGDPTGLSGAMIRINPDTGAPLPTNPGTGDLNARRIIAHGFRNPFRFAFRPGTTDVYVGDVGWLAWEEIDRIPDTTSQVRNYGWPCYEGTGRQGGYEALGLNLCRDLYTAGTAVPPLYTYNHSAKVAGESCPVGSSAVSGVTFYEGGSFPPAYRGAMFFADYARNCIWVMFPNADGTPNPSTRQVFADGASTPVDLEIGPGGDLYYADVGGGTIRRIRASNPNQAPTASFTATPKSGGPPLDVAFDATGSSDPNDDTLLYAWDLDGDGAYDDSTSATPSRTYSAEGNVTVRLRVTDPAGLTDTDETELTVGRPPTPTIAAPVVNSTYAVGDTVTFSGSATRDGAQVPASQLQWTVDTHHCSALAPTNCHVHHIQDYNGVESGSFVYPDHESPSYITLTLTATTPTGLHGQTSVRIDPKTVELTFNSVPAGLRLAVGGEASATPFTRTVAQGSVVGVAAPPSQFLNGSSYDFASWSDGGAAAHQFTASATATTYTATYAETVCPVLPGLVGAWGFDEASGDVVFDASGRSNTGTAAGATRTAAGRFGGALTFDGVNDLVTVPDSNSLHLLSGMTLEGWVNPTALGSTWRTVLLKEQPGNLTYALYASDDSGRPSGHVAVPSDARTNGPALSPNAWTHLATTYDGSTLRMYVNGTEVSSLPVSGSMSASNGALRIGGNTIWAEWFAGRIDELRMYDRALAPLEVQADMTRPVTCSSDPGAPALSVAPASLSFTGQQGGANPGAKTIDLANTGAGTLDWSISDDAPWLTVSPAGGSGARSVTVTPDLSGLTAGTYSANITISAPGASGSPRVVPVALTVDPPASAPALSVTPGSLAFTGVEGAADPAAKTLAVSNTGGGTLSWSVSDDATWLAVTPASGTNAGTITVSPSIAGLSAGTRTATVTVSANGGGSPKTIPVTLTIDPPPQPPALAVSPAALTFTATQGAATVDTKAVNVSNSGGGTLAFTASADVPWLTVSPTSDTAPRTVSVTPSTAGLAPGTYTGVVTVSASGVSGSPKTVGVTFTVTAPPLCVSPPGLVGAWAFDEASGTTTIDRSPSGNTGTVSGATRTAAGRFGGALSFDGVNDWVTVPDANSLDLSSGLTLSAWVNPAVAGSAWRTVLMKERSGGLSYALYGNSDSGQPSGHVSTPSETNTKGTSALPVGVWSHLATTYDGTTLRLFVNGVQVSSRALIGSIPADTGVLRIGGNSVWPEWFRGLIDEVRVYSRAQPAAELQSDLASPVTCSGPPAPAALTVAPGSLAFSGQQGGASPAAKTLDVANTGGGQMSWTASENAPWLSVAPASGTNAGAITVTPSISGLAAGTYTTDVTVAAAGATGSPRTVPVTFTVNPPPPVLAVSPGSLAFSGTAGGASPAAKTLDVSNTGGGSMSWTVAESAPWLSVTPGSGTNAGTITVTPAIAGLSPGTYTTDVVVTAAGAGGSPKTIVVTFTVDPPATPALAVAPSSLTFSATAGGASPAAKTLDVSNAGTGTLNWSASESAPWLSVSPGSSSGAGTITVTPAIAGLSAGTYTTDITVSAAGAAGSPKTIPVTLDVAAAPALAVAPGSLSFTATQGGANPAAQNVSVTNGGGGSLSFTAADDASWLAVSPSSGAAPATLSVAPSVAGLAQGTYTATVTVSAAGVSGSPKTVAVTLTVTAPPATPPGLVAAYGFEEASGTGVTDGSGNGRAGTISGATRSATGRSGRALSFDGVNDWVTVPDANALDLTTGVTMSAWVNPVAVGSTWRTVLMKEQPGGLIYALYAGDGTGKPTGQVFTTGEFRVTGLANTPLNAWTHLASTWDGTTLRLFVNGVEVSSRALGGTLRTSTGVLRIGGNSVWAEWFRGLIDEVRLYNRALTAGEIQADMARPVVAGGP